MSLRLTVLSSIAAHLLLYASVAQAETISIAADVWCPYNCEEGGYMIEIAKVIFKKNKIDVDYNIMPWVDAIAKTRDGAMDAVVGATHDDAPDFVFPDSLQGMSDMRFWVREDSDWSYEGIASLENVKLGVIEDYAYSKDLNDYIKQNAANDKRIHIAKGKEALKDNLEKLTSGELDVVAEDDNVINYLITNRSTEYRIKSVGTPVKGDDRSANYLYIAFSPKNPKAKQYAAMLDAGMKELRQSGELAHTLELYHVHDWYGISKK